MSCSSWNSVLQIYSLGAGIIGSSNFGEQQEDLASQMRQPSAILLPLIRSPAAVLDL